MNAAFVTGVSRGLGEAIAASLVDAGWRVFGIGRSAAPALAVPGFELVRCDLADLPAALSSAGLAMRSVTVDRAVLVNNAAEAGPVGLIGSLDAAAIIRSLTVNLVAPAALANAFCAAFADPRQPRLVINVTSGSAANVLAGSGMYSVAKCGMEMLTRALTADHPEASFRAITLRPGIIDTPMQEFMRTRSADQLPDVALFRKFHESGQLVEAATVAAKIRTRLIEGDTEAGRTYRYAEL